MNILLALRRRDASGEGAYLDIAMTDNLFTFTYWAIGNGLPPGNGRAPARTWSPAARRAISCTHEGRALRRRRAARADASGRCSSRRSGWSRSSRDDARDPAATATRIAEILRSRDGRGWVPRLPARTAAARSCRMCVPRWPMRISARAGCSRTCCARGRPQQYAGAAGAGRRCIPGRTGRSEVRAGAAGEQRGAGAVEAVQMRAVGSGNGTLEECIDAVARLVTWWSM